jgi:hypothetical protein
VAPQPFIYGRPVRPGEFLNREAELRTIFNRLRNCESTAVVGEPHIGKSSLLIKLADPATPPAYLGDDAHGLVVSLLDLHPVSGDYTPRAFWEEALEPLREYPDHTDRLKWVVQENYTRRSLEQLFNYLSQRNQRMLFLLDEFERLLVHPNFQDPAFFALLRSLATRTDGLVLVIASRLSVTEMNKYGRNLLEFGSTFFSNLIELRLQPFSKETAEELLNRASGVLSFYDSSFICRMAGRHPFLLQAMAATLLETEGQDSDRRIRAAERFYRQISYHFEELWRMLDDRARTGIVILSLVELGGRALGSKFNKKPIEEIAEKFMPELQRLEDMGLAEQIDYGSEDESVPLLKGKKWVVSTPVVVRWVHDVVIAKTHQVPAYDKWLEGKKYSFLLTQERWNSLVGMARNAVDWATQKGLPMVQLFYQIKAG